MLGNNSVADSRIEVTGDDVVEEGAGVLVGESLEREVGKIGEEARRSRFAHRKHQQHRFGHDAQRPTNCKAWREASSSHCVSSIKQTSGRSW